MHALQCDVCDHACARADTRTQVFSASLYLIIQESPQILEVLFNCTALTFVLEIDNIVVHLSPRRTAHCSHVIGQRLHVADVTVRELALYICAPADEWKRFGFHRLKSACRRNALNGLYLLMYLLTMMCHVLMYYTLTSCQHWDEPGANATST